MGGYVNRPIEEVIEVPGGCPIRRDGHQCYMVMGEDEENGTDSWQVEDEAEDYTYVHITVIRAVDDPDDYDRICIGSIEEARGIAAAINRICDELEGEG